MKAFLPSEDGKTQTGTLNFEQFHKDHTHLASRPAKTLPLAPAVELTESTSGLEVGKTRPWFHIWHQDFLLAGIKLLMQENPVRYEEIIFKINSLLP